VLYCPTLTVFEGYRRLFTGDLGDGLRDDLSAVSPWVRERVLRTPEVVPPAEASRARDLAQRGAERLLVMEANLRRLHDAGVPVVLGTDAGNPLTLHGPSVFRELEAMAAAGMEPLEVLAAATSVAARALGREDDLGRVAPGYVADLLVLEEDPAAGVTAFRSLRRVLRAGVLHEREDLAGR